MGLLDFLFSNKKEQERLERERQEALAREQRQKEEREAEAKRKAAQQAKAKVEHEHAAKSSPIKSEVDSIIATFEANNIDELQQRLYQLYSKFSRPGGGKLITSFPEKDRLSEVFSMYLMYDWIHDDDLREVWAENGFYCIAEYFKEAKSMQDYFAAALDLFILCCNGKDSLYPKFNDILRKARVHPFHCAVFSEENYQGGARHLVREFQFFSATLISGVERNNPQVISRSLRDEYERAKTDYQFASVSPDVIIKKMTFISAIIGSILDDM